MASLRKQCLLKQTFADYNGDVHFVHLDNPPKTMTNSVVVDCFLSKAILPLTTKSTWALPRSVKLIEKRVERLTATLKIIECVWRLRFRH